MNKHILAALATSLLLAAASLPSCAPLPKQEPPAQQSAKQQTQQSDKQQAQQSAEQASLERIVREAALKAQNGDLQGAKTVLEPAVKDPAFPRVDSRLRYAAYHLLGVALLATGDVSDALANLRKACAEPWATGTDWYLRAEAAIGAHHNGDAVLALTTLAGSWPDTLSEVPDRAVLQIVNDTASLPLQQERGLVEALAAANWKPHDPFLPPAPYYLALVRVRIDEGNISGALEAAHKLTALYSLVAIRDDSRFAIVLERMRDFFDPANYMKRLWQTTQAKVAAAPDRLGGIYVKGNLLLQRGEPQAALDLTQTALTQALAQQKSGDAAPFSDISDQLNWILNVKENALLDLGRNEEAVQTLKQAARTPENGMFNVSQTINLAGLYVTLGRPKAALQTLATFDNAPMSDYGKMALASVRACAYAQTGNKAARNETLANMAKHSADGVRAYLHALLCTGDAASAAKVIISELASPAQRTQTLLELQDYKQLYPQSAADRQSGRTLRAVTQRPDVKAAVAKVGRIEHYDFQSANY